MNLFADSAVSKNTRKNLGILHCIYFELINGRTGYWKNRKLGNPKVF